MVAGAGGEHEDRNGRDEAMVKTMVNIEVAMDDETHDYDATRHSKPLRFAPPGQIIHMIRRNLYVHDSGKDI